MNTLSWFLYLADVVHGLGVLFLFGGLTAGAIALVVTMAFSEFPDLSPKWVWFSWAVAFCLLLVSVLVPSKSTMYAIAASELGEQAVKSELGQKGIKAIEVWIDEQLNKKK